MSSQATNPNRFELPELTVPVGLGLALVLALLTFGRATFQAFPFVWDDRSAIAGSTEMQGGQVAAVARQAFMGPADPADHTHAYRPVAAVSFALNSMLTGYRSPAFHAVNLLLHLVAVALLFFLARASLESVAGAAAAAAMLASHPLAAGVVGWVAGRAELLGLVFALGAALVYRRSTSSGRDSIGLLAAAWVLALLSMLSHESGLALLLALPLLDRWAPGFQPARGMGSFFSRQGGLWAAAFLYLALRVHAHPAGLDAGIGSEARPLFAALTIGRALFYDVLVALLPLLTTVLSPLVVSGPRGLEVVNEGSGALGALAVPALLVMLALSIGVLMRHRAAGVGLLWFWLALLPLLDLSIVTATTPDRALYIPLAGLSIAFGALAMWLFRRLPSPRTALVAVLGILLVHTGVGIARVGLWKDEVSLPQTLAARHPQNSTALTELGAAYGRSGKTEEALKTFRAARSVDSLDARAACNLALAYVRAGKPDSAILVLGPALRNSPGMPELHLAAAEALLAKGEVAEAMSSYADVLDHDTTNVTAHMGMAQIYYGQHQLPEAVIELQRALEFAPRDPRIHNNLGLVYFVARRFDEADKEFRRAIQLDGSVSQFYYNLARLKYQQGQYAEAMPPVQKLMELLPGNPGPRALRDTIQARLSRGAPRQDR